MLALVIDDNELNAEVLQRLLRLYGLEAEVLTEPSTLPQWLASAEALDLAFIDLEMPDITGYDALEMLRQRYGEATRLIACTVHVSEAGEASRRGFDGFIAKPINPDQFKDQLTRILRGESVWTVRP